MVKTQALLTLATLAAVSAFAPQQMPGNVRVIEMARHGELGTEAPSIDAPLESCPVDHCTHCVAGIMSHDLSLLIFLLLPPSFRGSYIQTPLSSDSGGTNGSS